MDDLISPHSALMTPLLGPDEPAPYACAGQRGASPFVIVCDHAGRALPRSLGSLGLTEPELRSHIAWDIGAEGVSRRLADLLDAFVAWQRYSRLVIDCNRPLDATDSIVALSERTPIPGNQNLVPGAARARARAIFEPYHAGIREHLDLRERVARSTVVVAMHSFTPVFDGRARPWHVGVLFNRDARLAERVLDLLRAESGLAVGSNQPYAASEISDYSLVHHGEKRGLPCVELEIRQDLIADEAGQAAWANRIAHVLSAALDSGPW